MTLPRSYVDGFLVDWEAGEYEAQVRSMRQVSKPIAPDVHVPGWKGQGRRAGATAQRAQTIRERLARTVRKVPEVMVKITSSSKGMMQIGRHIDYITRKGQIDLEDQDGLIVRGKDPLKALKDEWRIDGFEEIPAVSDRRDTLNIVLSMPAHTEELGMKRAVRAFAADTFPGHQYVFAYHTQATDPDPTPPAHPHVHLSVKMQGRSGRRLNPRKADLQRWREAFAGQLRAHGIEANATSRLARLQPERGKKRSSIAVTARVQPSQAAEAAPRDKRPGDSRLEADRRAYYGLLSRVLAQSELASDRVLAGEVSRQFLRPGLHPDLPQRDRDRDA